GYGDTVPRILYRRQLFPRERRRGLFANRRRRRRGGHRLLDGQIRQCLLCLARRDIRRVLSNVYYPKKSAKYGILFFNAVENLHFWRRALVGARRVPQASVPRENVGFFIRSPSFIW